MDTETEGGGQNEGRADVQTVDQSNDKNPKLPAIDPQRSSKFGDKSDPNGNFVKVSNHNSANNSDSGIEAEAPDVINPSTDQRKDDPTYGASNLPESAAEKESMFSYNNVLPFITSSGHGYDQFSRNNNQDPNSRDLRNSGSTTHSNSLHANNGYIYQEKLNFRKMAKSRVRSLDNLSYCTPQPSNYKIFNEKVNFRSLARSKLDTYSCLDYKNQRPQVVIFREKVDFNSNAKARIGSLENLNFQPRSNPNLKIFDEPLQVEGKPKIKSFENINFSPRKIEKNIVQHNKDWFTPAKSNSNGNENSYFPSINNTNPIQLETSFKRRITPRFSENDNMKIEVEPNNQDLIEISSKMPRNRIKKHFSHQSEPVFNNKKVHFVSNDELSAAHRKKFAQQVASEENQLSNQFQAIHEESGLTSDQVTPRNLETRQNKSRLRGRRHTKVFPDESESKGLTEDSRHFANASRLGSRDALPEIGEKKRQKSGYESPEENKRVLQEPVQEEVYDAVVEKAGVPLDLTSLEDQKKNSSCKAVSAKKDEINNKGMKNGQELAHEKAPKKLKEPANETKPLQPSEQSPQKPDSDKNFAASQTNAHEPEIGETENDDVPDNTWGSPKTRTFEELSSEKLENVSKNAISMSKNSFVKLIDDENNDKKVDEKVTSEVSGENNLKSDDSQPEQLKLHDTRDECEEESQSEVLLENNYDVIDYANPDRSEAREIRNEIIDQNEAESEIIQDEKRSEEGSPENLDISFDVGEKNDRDSFSKNDDVPATETNVNKPENKMGFEATENEDKSSFHSKEPSKATEDKSSSEQGLQ